LFGKKERLPMPPSAHLIDAELAPALARVEGRSGLVATAAWDEDAVTLGTAAGLAVRDRNPDLEPAALITATVSAPLPEPGISPILAEALDLQTTATRSVRAVEHSGTVAAGVAAVIAAVEMVHAGVGPVLVVASDTRRTDRGKAMGDGAVALLIGSGGDAGTIEPAGAAVEYFTDRWRRRGAEGIEAGDRSLDRFGPGKAFTAGLEPDGYDAVVATGVEGPALPRAGFLGCAAPLAALLAASREQGERLLVSVSAGGVSQAFSFQAGLAFSTISKRALAALEGGVVGTLQSTPDESSFHPFTSQASARRERSATFRLEARRDPATGEVIYPPPPEAASAGLEPIRLARTGVVHTFARDHVFPIGGPITMAVVSLDGGGRFYGQVAGTESVEIGDRVELVLRRLHSGGGLPHYFWKVAPSRGES
jgi:uncharacterized OB-fold protein